MNSQSCDKNHGLGRASRWGHRCGSILGGKRWFNLNWEIRRVIGLSRWQPQLMRMDELSLFLIAVVLGWVINVEKSLFPWSPNLLHNGITWRSLKHTKTLQFNSLCEFQTKSISNFSESQGNSRGWSVPGMIDALAVDDLYQVLFGPGWIHELNSYNLKVFKPWTLSW